MSAKITLDEAILAFSFFEQLMAQPNPFQNPFSFPMFPLHSDTASEVRVAQMYTSAAANLSATGIATSEPRSMNSVLEASDQKKNISSKMSPERRVVLRKANHLFTAKNVYNTAVNTDVISVKAKDFIRALMQIEKGLLIGTPTSITHYGLNCLKARIHLDIFEKSDLREFLSTNPDINSKYHFTHMSLDEIETMAETASTELAELSTKYPGRTRSKREEFAGLLQRIEGIRVRCHNSN